MSERMNLGKVAPDGYRILFELERYLHANLDSRLLNLVKLRASMVNGCGYCVDQHGTDLLKAGEDVRRVLGVSAWREFPFDERDRVVLALTDEVTRIAEHGVSDEVWNGARAHFSEKELADLILAIGAINLWNRIGVSTDLQPAL
ncbi:alkyl hydroperoxide reductase AhpD [Catellatospora sp. TT07R-123]|uniref:carboxymuconolactone decarboxylase family protein n=1 Tax=Catellatospora sp. TT07R-123 TaxID=2733863 RepID=UPI001B1AF324|nr:carboxymuconolactone decarboxylase family protein [Catellatospora sp. TT07R-123]GHJ48165.1 alkyl hydroperoxide reductase AhpD [Catellatospora sp. TT07R-123]